MSKQLEAQWGWTIREAAIKRHRDQRHMGILVNSMRSRIYNFYSDLRDYCAEFWSHTIQWGSGGTIDTFSFAAMGPNGAKLHVDVLGNISDPLKGSRYG